MGCTRISTPDEHRETLRGLEKVVTSGKEPLTAKLRTEIRTELHRSDSAKKLLNILENPKSPLFKGIESVLVKVFQSKSKITEREAQDLPHALRVILKGHPTAMGIFMAATKERAPGQSAVQHHYEILSAAALIEGKFKTTSGKTLSIAAIDRLDFGMKMASGYFQTKRGGTIEADFLINKKTGMFGLEEKTIGVDSKYSEVGKYSADKTELARQLEGIRTGFRDGKLDEFIFVTNGTFQNNFNEMVKNCNSLIIRDAIDEKNLRIGEIPREYLTPEEKEQLPPETIPTSILQDTDKVRELVSLYGIPQIDLCENVNFKNYDSPT